MVPNNYFRRAVETFPNQAVAAEALGMAPSTVSRMMRDDEIPLRFELAGKGYLSDSQARDTSFVVAAVRRDDADAVLKVLKAFGLAQRFDL